MWDVVIFIYFVSMVRVACIMGVSVVWVLSTTPFKRNNTKWFLWFVEVVTTYQNMYVF